VAEPAGAPSESKAAAAATLAKWTPVIPYLAVAVGVLLVLYFVYKKFGPGATDPGGGRASTGVLDGILNQTLEIGKSSETYTDASLQTALHPVTTLESIVGYYPTEAPAVKPNPTMTAPDATADPSTDIGAQLAASQGGA